MRFIDFETRSACNLKTRGAYNYATHPSTDILCLAHDDGAGGVPAIWSPSWCSPEQPADQQTETRQLLALFTYVEAGGLLCARKCEFEFYIWNRVLVRKYGAPPLPIEQIIDSAAQVAASNVPRSLDGSAKVLRVANQKDSKGKSLISKLSIGTREEWQDTPETRELMVAMRAYCIDDVKADRDTFAATRQLTRPEWIAFFANEHVNRRGVHVDLEFAQAATRYAEQETLEINLKLQAVTGRPTMRVTTGDQNAKYAFALLENYPDAQRLLVRPPNPKNGLPRYCFDKDVKRELDDMLNAPPYDDDASDELETLRAMLEVLEGANSASVKKYKAIEKAITSDGRLVDMFVFNGAGQTGRASSKGVQLHNLRREPLIEASEENGLTPKQAVNLHVELMDAIVAGNEPEIKRILDLCGLPLMEALGRLLRPTLQAGPGNVFVWGDWRSIEWVVLPWLAKNAWGDRRLEFFLSGRDPYRATAAQMFRTSYEAIPKSDPRRQIGKIAELSLGFLGGKGALRGMARKFGMRMSPEESQGYVDAWREANGGAVSFGNKLMTAVHNAIGQPGVWFTVGRVRYCYVANLMRGTVVCQLPCGRLIHYPHVKVVRELNEKFGTIQTSITFRKGFGRAYLWRGLLMENITQASANSLLRVAVVDLQDVAVFHTHDEVGVECAFADEPAMRARVEETLLRVPSWAEGLPIQVELSSGPFYYK